MPSGRVSNSGFAADDDRAGDVRQVGDRREVVLLREFGGDVERVGVRGLGRGPAPSGPSAARASSAVLTSSPDLAFAVLSRYDRMLPAYSGIRSISPVLERGDVGGARADVDLVGHRDAVGCERLAVDVGERDVLGEVRRADDDRRRRSEAVPTACRATTDVEQPASARAAAAATATPAMMPLCVLFMTAVPSWMGVRRGAVGARAACCGWSARSVRPSATPRGTTSRWASGEDAVDDEGERGDEDRAGEHLDVVAAARGRR